MPATPIHAPSRVESVERHSDSLLRSLFSYATWPACYGMPFFL